MNVGSGDVIDFTALGDTVNTAARLQSEAAGGEVVFREESCQTISDDFQGLEQRELTLRGREGTLPARVLRV